MPGEAVAKSLHYSATIAHGCRSGAIAANYLVQFLNYWNSQLLFGNTNAHDGCFQLSCFSGYCYYSQRQFCDKDEVCPGWPIRLHISSRLSSKRLIAGRRGSPLRDV